MKQQVVVQNLKCGGCANTITTELNKLQGVDNTKVDESTAIVEFESTEEAKEAVANRLDELGYPIDSDSNSILKKAKSYVSCAVGRITK